MWAEAMEIYRSGKCQLRLPKEMEKELCEYQKQFMQEDTKKELILDYLEHYEGSMVCSRQLYSEALGNDGRILVRESGTEPVIRVMVEAADHAACEKYVDQVIEVIKQKGYKED